MAAEQSSLYVPLDPTGNETRLLTIQKGEDEVISCELKTVSLDDQPFYYALSYCWGDPSVTETITVNGEVVSITVNLKTALGVLKTLEDGKYAVSVWVDALCINQCDISEKNHQVPLMGKIFSSAEKVICWLGEEDEPTKNAFKIISLIATREIEDPPSKEDLVYMAAAFTRSYFILSRPYWTRIWILQEVCLGRQGSFVLCGSTTIDLDLLLNGIRKAWKLRSNSQYIGVVGELQNLFIGLLGVEFDDLVLNPQVPSTLERDDLRDAFLKVVRLRDLRSMVPSDADYLGYWVMMTVTQLATKPADKAYALLGLLEQGEQGIIPVNYEAPHMKIFQDLFAALWQRNMHALTGLSDFEYSRENPCCGDYPTWVPDLCHQSDITILNSPIGANRWTKGNAPRISDDKSLLMADGVVLDTVSKELTAAPTETPKMNDILSSFKTIQDCLDRLKIDDSMDINHPLYSLRHLRTAETSWEVVRVGGRSPGLRGLEDDVFTDYWTKVACSDDFHINREAYFENIETHRKEVIEMCFDNFTGQAQDTFSFYKPIETEGRFWGLGPKTAQPGDILVAFYGFETPFMLRKQPDGRYHMIGVVYLSGLKDFKVLEPLFDKGILKNTTFVIS